MSGQEHLKTIVFCSHYLPQSRKTGNPGDGFTPHREGEDHWDHWKALSQSPSTLDPYTICRQIFDIFFAAAPGHLSLEKWVLIHTPVLWLSGKESACNAGDMGTIPGLGRSPGVGNGHPLQYSFLGSPMDKGA